MLTQEHIAVIEEAAQVYESAAKYHSEQGFPVFAHSQAENAKRFRDVLTVVSGLAQQDEAPARGWRIKRLHDLGSVYNASGEMIAQTYYHEAKAFVDAHNASAGPAAVGAAGQEGA